MPSFASTRVTKHQPFIADRDSIDSDTGHSVNWGLVGEEYRQFPGQTIVVSGTAAQGATSLPVAAIVRAIPSGTTIVFDAAAGEFATTSALAAAGATTLTVQPLPQAFEGAETGVVPGRGTKRLPAGTRVGTLLSGDDRISPRIVTTNPAIGLLMTDADEVSNTDAISGYGVILGGIIYENCLPGAVGNPMVIPTAEKTELKANGSGFVFKQYYDSSAL